MKEENKHGIRSARKIYNARKDKESLNPFRRFDVLNKYVRQPWKNLPPNSVKGWHHKFNKDVKRFPNLQVAKK